MNATQKTVFGCKNFNSAWFRMALDRASTEAVKSGEPQVVGHWPCGHLTVRPKWLNDGQTERLGSAQCPRLICTVSPTGAVIYARQGSSAINSGGRQ